MENFRLFSKETISLSMILNYSIIHLNKEYFTIEIFPARSFFDLVGMNDVIIAPTC